MKGIVKTFIRLKIFQTIKGNIRASSAAFCGIVFLCILLLAPVHSISFDPPIPTPRTHSIEAVQDFFRIYFTTLNLVDSGIAFRYTLNDAETIQAFMDDIAREEEIVGRLNLDKAPFAKDYDQKTFDLMTIPMVFRYRLQYGITIPGEEIKQFLNAHSERFSTRKMVFGWEIFVEGDDKKSTETLRVLKNIQKQLEKDDFQRVAMNYYQGIGIEYDGSLGTVYRGNIPDWEFDIFLKASPADPFFGPVEVSDGFLFGKLYKKYTLDTKPEEFYGDSISRRLITEKYRSEIESFYKSQKDLLKPDVFRYDHASTKGLEQIAYRFGDYKLTFDQVLKRLPHYSGNPQDPRFYDAMTKHAFEDDLINRSSKAEEVRKSPEYLFLAKAHSNAWLVDHYVKEQLNRLPTDPESLKTFYREKGEVAFPNPDIVTLLIIYCPRDASLDARNAYIKRSAKRPDFQAALRLKESYEKAPSVNNARILSQKIPGVRWELKDKAMPEDNLGRILEMGIKDVPEGGIAGPLAAGKEFLIVHVLSRKKQCPKPFEEVQEQLSFDYMLFHKRKLLRELYQTDRVMEYF